MGMLYQRGRTWWIKYYFNGEPVRESSKSELKMVARELLKQREGDISQGKLPGIYFEKATFDGLAADFLADYKLSGKDVVLAELNIRHLADFFGGLKAKDITTPRIREYTERRLEQEKRTKPGIKKTPANATVNRELAALKRLLNMGAKQTPPAVDRGPHICMSKERNVRTGFFDHGEFLLLRDAMPEHLKGLVTFGYKTGWRIDEITSLSWANADLKAGTVTLHLDESKNEEGRTIFLDDELRELLTRQRKAQKKNGTALPSSFLNEKGTDRVKRFDKAWKTACKNAGIGLKLLHDFRRTVVRNMVRAGIPERVAMMVSGHKTRSVFERYNIVSEADLRMAAQKQLEYLDSQPTGTNSGTVVSLKTRKTAARL